MKYLVTGGAEFGGAMNKSVSIYYSKTIPLVAEF